MSASNSNSPFNDPSYTRERLELETRVLAAALRQSLEIGDTEGSSLAHEQIFLLLKASQEMVIDEPLNLPREVFIDRGRQLPDIDWGAAEEKPAEQTQPVQQVPQTAEDQQVLPGPESDFTPPIAADARSQGAASQPASADLVQASAEAVPVAGVPATTIDPGETLVEAPDGGLVGVPVEGYVEATSEGLVEAPIEGLVEAPVEVSGQAPVEGSGQAPVEGSGQAPVEALVEASVEGLGEAPVEALVEAPVEVLGEAPIAGLAETPVDGLIEIRVEEGVEAPTATVDLVAPAQVDEVSDRGSDMPAYPEPALESTGEAAPRPANVSSETELEVIPAAPTPSAQLQAAEPLSQDNSEVEARLDVIAAVPGQDSWRLPGTDSQPQPEFDATMINALQAQAQAQKKLEPSVVASPETGETDYYQQLKVTDVADFPSIHLAFWRMLRVLLQKEIGLVGPDRLHHLKQIQRLWIAHDILCDPVTRADYDFRRMGLRGGGTGDEYGRTFHRGAAPRTQLRIGELLQCAGLLEQTELEIAADMHKAMPEMMFGTFLVKQGFIEDADLDCVLIGQQLLKSGDITVVQFQTVMVERSATGLDIGEMLLAKGYVDEGMLERAYREQSEDTLVKVPVVLGPGPSSKIEAKQSTAGEGLEQGEPALSEAQPAHADAVESFVAAEPASLVEAFPADASVRTDRSFKFGNAAPAWKDQLDWSSPESPADAGNAAAAASGDGQPGTDDKQVDQADSRWSAPDMVVPGSPMDDALTASVKAIAQIWAATPDPVSMWARVEPDDQAPPHSEDSSQGSTGAARADQSGDPGALPAVADGSVETLSDTPALPADSAGFGQQVGEDMVNNPFVLGEAEEQATVPSAPAPAPSFDFSSAPISETATDPSLSRIVEPDVVSEIETSGQLPSLGELELKARAKEEQQEMDRKRASGDWQIMSVPGSALSSLFLDEEPDTPHRDPTMAKEITGQMNAFIDENEDQLEAEPKPDQESKTPAPSTPQKPPPEESKRARRRRTRH
jgi:hypothetical protein